MVEYKLSILGDDLIIIHGSIRDARTWAVHYARNTPLSVLISAGKHGVHTLTGSWKEVEKVWRDHDTRQMVVLTRGKIKRVDPKTGALKEFTRK